MRIPFVPTIGSRMNAAMVCGPSSWIVSSRSANASSTLSHPRLMPWYGSSTWTTPPAVRGVEVDALGAHDGMRFETGLRRPVVQRVAQAELGDLLRAEGLHGLHHHALILAS